MVNNPLPVFILILTLLCTQVFAQQTAKTTGKQALTNYIESLKKDDDLKNAAWSVKVVNCKTKKTLSQYQSAINLVPASILKLVTTGVGSLYFKNNYTFTTTLAYDGEIDADSVLQGNVYLIGGGDPTFGSSQFKNTSADSIFNHFLQSIKKSGIRSINGKLIADVSLFDDTEINDTWEWGDIGNYYGTGTSALPFCENAFDISIKPGSSVNQAATLGNPKPALFDAVIKNNVRTTSKDTSVDALVYSTPMHSEYWINGGVPISKDSVVAKGAIQNPAMVCLLNLDYYLSSKGVSTVNKFSIKSDTSKITISDTITQWQSPTYREIAENTNRYSNNMFAESILKGLAARNSKSTPATYTVGINLIMSKLKSNELDTKTMRIMDGSGLSRQNLISADFMCQFLLMMYGAYPAFDKLMPAPGEKGTLSGFMSSYKNNRSKVRMKSGSMTGVLNYAGYVKNTKGETLCITIMTNNFTCKVSKVRPKLEKLVYLITESE